MPIFISVIACVGPNGTTTNTVNAASTTMKGAIQKTVASASAGMMSSFSSSLIASAIGCNSPCGPTRIGPSLTCMCASAFRSSQFIATTAREIPANTTMMYTNAQKYGYTSAASVPIALAEAVNEGRLRVGDNVCIVAFGAGFTSGAVTIEWTADPARGIAGDAAVDPRDVHVRLPIDWDSVDPIPPALAELMARPSEVNPPLDDVVPGEPEPASHPVAR